MYTYFSLQNKIPYEQTLLTLIQKDGNRYQSKVALLLKERILTCHFRQRYHSSRTQDCSFPSLGVSSSQLHFLLPLPLFSAGHPSVPSHAIFLFIYLSGIYLFTIPVHLIISDIIVHEFCSNEGNVRQARHGSSSPSCPRLPLNLHHRRC